MPSARCSTARRASTWCFATRNSTGIRGRAIENVRLLSPSGERVSLAQLTTVSTDDGAEEIYREGEQRYVAIKYSVRDRDLGSTVEEAIKKVNAAGSAAGLATTTSGRASTRASSARTLVWR